MKIQTLLLNPDGSGFSIVGGEVEVPLEAKEWSIINIDFDNATNIIQAPVYIGNERCILRVYLYRKAENILIRTYPNEEALPKNEANRQYVIEEGAISVSAPNHEGDYFHILFNDTLSFPVLNWKVLIKLLWKKIWSYFSRSY